MMVLAPHQVKAVLELKGHVWKTRERLTSYEAKLLESVEVTVDTYSTLNPASLLPTELLGDNHSSEEITSYTMSSRLDPLDIPCWRWTMSGLLTGVAMS
jgi:hypothetical protein